jgi:N-acetylneuraminic acid mutarotase
VGFGRPSTDIYSALNDFWEYDPVYDQWTRKADFPFGKKSDVIGCSLNSIGYTAFGINYNPINNTVYSCYDIFSYYPASDTWIKCLTDSSFEFSNMGKSFTINENLYITSSSGFRKFDPIKNEISNYGLYHSYSISGLAFSSKSLGYTLMQDWSGTYHLMEFNPNTTLWTQMNEPIDDILIDGFAFTVNDRVFIVSGYSNYASNKIYEYNVNDNSIIELDDFPGEPRNYFISIVFDHKTYIGMGYRDGKAFNDFYEFNPEKF